MTDKIISIKSIPTNMPLNCSTTPGRKTSPKAILLRRISTVNCGIIIGKPRMAIKLACCMALDAMALNKVKTMAKLVLPRMAIPKNMPACIKGSLPNNTAYKPRLMALKTDIKTKLKISFDKINATG